MTTISFTSARDHFANIIKKCKDNYAPITITRRGESVAVLMSIEEYCALEETAYLLRSPKNAQRLLASINELESGNAQQQELVE